MRPCQRGPSEPSRHLRLAWSGSWWCSAGIGLQKHPCRTFGWHALFAHPVYSWLRRCSAFRAFLFPFCWYCAACALGASVGHPVQDSVLCSSRERGSSLPLRLATASGPGLQDSGDAACDAPAPRLSAGAPRAFLRLLPSRATSWGQCVALHRACTCPAKGAHCLCLARQRPRFWQRLLRQTDGAQHLARR